MPKSKLEKQKEAESRASLRAKRSHKDQISRLDSLFGVGAGAAKERARLLSLIEEEKKPKKKQDSAEENSDKKTRKKKKSEVAS